MYTINLGSVANEDNILNSYLGIKNNDKPANTGVNEGNEDSTKVESSFPKGLESDFREYWTSMVVL